MQEQKMTPASEKSITDEQGIAKVYSYEDIEIQGAALTDLHIIIRPSDAVELSARVKSKNTQTKESGPHHIVAFTHSDETVTAKEVLIGEFHWKCGHNGIIRLAKNVRGAYTRAVGHPTWQIRSFGPRPC